MTTASAASGWAPEPLGSGAHPSVLTQGPARGTRYPARGAAYGPARGADLGARRHSRPPGVAHARPARHGLVDQNAGMTEPSDQVDSMYCFT